MVGAKITNAELTALGELMNTGKVRPVIGRRYRLEEVREAVRYVEHGHAQGKVIITVK
jgi:NADPH:quinone reductase-like Zn-dependent oxidoreductase